MAESNHDPGAVWQAAAREKVWDLPVRLFHWASVCLVAICWYTATQELFRIHLGSGLALLTLLLFRIVWGLVGSTTARFSDFVHRPAEVVGYLRGTHRRLHAGHNPAGGLMVLALIGALLAQVLTGLFANDGSRFNAPLAMWVSADWSDRCAELHSACFAVIELLVWMHLVAVFFYLLVRDESLITPMLTGYKQRRQLPAGLRLRFVHSAFALAIFAVTATAVGWALH